jgi:hypothetical protein
MIKAPVRLQDLRRRIYVKAKAIEIGCMDPRSHRVGEQQKGARPWQQSHGREPSKLHMQLE